MKPKEQARRVYEALRVSNPHLPPSERVSTASMLALQFGDGLPTLTLEVYVDLPDAWKET